MSSLAYNDAGLVCAVVQQFDTKEVLMVAWMDAEALRRTLTTGRGTYFSRSRREYWVKGETSGNTQRVIEVRRDCDGDTLLVLVDQTGVACHMVNDGLVNSASDIVQIATQNRIPLAAAGPDQSNIAVNGTVQLDGSASADPDGTPLTFAWTFDLRPSASTAVLLNGDTATPTFTADRSGRYRIQLIVGDGLANSVPDTVDVTTVNQPPIANAGPDQTVHENDLVTLNGNGSTDPDNNPLTYAWSFVSKPGASTAQLSSPTAASPTFTPDVAGLYTLRLVVNDTIVDSPPDTVAITVLSSAITMFLVDTPLVGAGRQTRLRVTLPFAAPAGGVVVAVSSDNDQVVTVDPPASVTIPQGADTSQVTLRGIAPGVTTVRAAAPGYADGALQITVTQNVLSVPATLNVPLGQTTSLPITIPNPAPLGGVAVDITSSNPALVEVQTATVLIPQGAVSANATVRGNICRAEHRHRQQCEFLERQLVGHHYRESQHPRVRCDVAAGLPDNDHGAARKRRQHRRGTGPGS